MKRAPHKVVVASGASSPYVRRVAEALTGAGVVVHVVHASHPTWTELGVPPMVDVRRFTDAMGRDDVRAALEFERKALMGADAVLVVLPADTSAHLAAAFAHENHRPVVWLAPDVFRPELLLGLFRPELPALLPLFDQTDAAVGHLMRVCDARSPAQ